MVPLLTFVLVSYGMSTLNDGEAKLGAVFIGTAFSMLPYLLMTPVLITLSRILSASDAAIYYGLSALVWAWVCFQFYRQVNILNNYTLPQTVGLIVLTLCGMLALWALLVLLYFLSRNLFQLYRKYGWKSISCSIDRRGGRNASQKSAPPFRLERKYRGDIGDEIA